MLEGVSCPLSESDDSAFDLLSLGYGAGWQDSGSLCDLLASCSLLCIMNQRLRSNCSCYSDHNIGNQDKLSSP